VGGIVRGTHQEKSELEMLKSFDSAMKSNYQKQGYFIQWFSYYRSDGQPNPISMTAFDILGIRALNLIKLKEEILGKPLGLNPKNRDTKYTSKTTS
jgi:hypothetical protein